MSGQSVGRSMASSGSSANAIEPAYLWSVVADGEAFECRLDLCLGEVADLDLRLAAGRAEPVLGHAYRHAPPDDVAAGAEPCALLELQAECDSLGERTVDGRREPRWLEHDHADAGAAGVCREAAERALMGSSIGLEVDHEQVY